MYQRHNTKYNVNVKRPQRTKYLQTALSVFLRHPHFEYLVVKQWGQGNSDVKFISCLHAERKIVIRLQYIRSDRRKLTSRMSFYADLSQSYQNVSNTRRRRERNLFTGAFYFGPPRVSCPMLADSLSSANWSLSSQKFTIASSAP